MSTLIDNAVKFEVNLKHHGFEAVPKLNPDFTLVLDSRFKGPWNIFADLDNDGICEIISARVSEYNDVHETVSVMAAKLTGELLWTWGNPDAGIGAIHSDIACQVFDWDNDGIPEVIIATAAYLIVLDGLSGQEKFRFPIPWDATDSLYFTDFSGNTELDVVVKNRYKDIWVYKSNGTLLWHLPMPGKRRTAHQPRMVQLSKDKYGFIPGHSCYDKNKTLLWDLLDQGQDYFPENGHLDCVRELKVGDRPEDTELLMTFCGGRGFACVNGNGEIKWIKKGLHWESIDIGKVQSASDGKQIIVDVDHCLPGESPLHVYSETGDMLGEIISNRSRSHKLVWWDDSEVQRILLAEDHVIIDGQSGNPIYQLNCFLPQTNIIFEDKQRCFENKRLGGLYVMMSAVADIDGDGRQEIILSTNPGGVIWIFKNPFNIPKRNLPLGSGNNFSLY